MRSAEAYGERTEGAQMKEASSPFFLYSGGELKNLNDLHKSLKKMSDAEFNFHVNVNKNDFAKWVHHCMKDHSLSMCLGQLKTKQEMAKAVRKKIKEDENPVTSVVPISVKPKISVKPPKPVAIPAVKEKPVKITKPPLKVTKKVKLAEKIKRSKPSKWLKTVQDRTQQWEETRRSPLPMTMEQIEQHIRNKLVESEVVAKGLPDVEVISDEPPLKPNYNPIGYKNDIMQHIVPYALGIMAGVVIGIVLFRFLI